MAEDTRTQGRYGAQTGARAAAVDEGLRAHMLRVYNYMTGGLVLTGLVAYVAATVPAVRDIFFTVQVVGGSEQLAMNLLGWIALFAPLGLVFFLGFRVHKMSFTSAQTVFWVFAGLMGIGLAPVVLAYTGVSIAKVFFITASMFAAMSLFGYTTKRDISGWGSFLFMGLIGIIIAMIVNMFLASAMLDFVISVIGVLVFAGLTAYDTQKIKNTYLQIAGSGGELVGKAALMGALSLYLDFVNMFLFLLQLFGNRE